MPLQTSYSATARVGYPGMVPDMRICTVISREVALSSAAVAFGVPVLRGATDHTCMAVGTSGAVGFIGISVASATVRPGNLDTYVAGDTAAVMIKGIISVTVASAVSPGAAAYYDSSGNITAASAGNFAIAGAVFETTAASGGLAQLRIGS